MTTSQKPTSEEITNKKILGNPEASTATTRERQMECEDSVIAMIQRRRARGRAKYGHTMERQDLNMPEWMTHAQEEALDLAIYLEAIKRRVPYAKRRPLAEKTIQGIVNDMPGGVRGYCSQWGWLTFARRIEQAHKIR